MEVEVGAFSYDRLGQDRHNQLVFFTKVPLLNRESLEGRDGLVFPNGMRLNAKRVALLTEHGRHLVLPLLGRNGVTVVRVGNDYMWVLVERKELWIKLLEAILDHIITYQRGVIDDQDENDRVTIPLRKKFLHGDWHGKLLAAYNRKRHEER